MNKKTILTMLFATLTMGAAAQTTKNVDVKNDSVIINSTTPEYPGGEKALTKFLTKNVKYPDLAEEYGVEGRVVMTFVVDKNGTLKDIAAKDCKIERFNTTKFSQEPEARQAQLKEQFALLFAKEGARVIRKMPKWTPGKINGKAVGVNYSLSILFCNPYK